MLLIVEKGTRGGIIHSMQKLRYAKTNNKYMKDFEKNKEFSYLKYWEGNDLYRWEML